MLSLALIGIIWEFIYSPNYGLINTVIGHNTNANLIDWLGNPKLNLWAVLVEASWRQIGYVMVLYLAGLKSVDPSLREAALIDGANAWQTFWRVIFPAMRPINIIVLVVTVIESLRAFDLVYITNQGTNGLRAAVVADHQQHRGEVSRIGFGSALGRRPAGDLAGAHLHLPVPDVRTEREPDVSAPGWPDRRLRADDRRLSTLGYPAPVRAVHLASARTARHRRTATSPCRIT